MRPCWWLTAIGLLLAGGCGNPRLDDIETGLYSLEVEVITDTCEPARATGGFASAALVRPDGLTLWVPTGTVVPRLEPAPLDDDLETRLPSEPLGECEGGERNRKVTVTGTTSKTIGAVVTDVFAGLGGCPSDSAFVPEADCRSERRLRYTRREACPDGCGIAEAPDGNSFACDCPGGGDAGM